MAMSYVVQRREEERERRRQEILTAAEDLYARRGWDAVTMDQIARQARLSRALLYVYFRDKDDVLLAISELAMSDLRRRFAIAVQSRSVGIDKVEAVGRAYVEWALAAPHRFDACARFQARPGATSTPEPDGTLQSCQAAGDAVLAEVAGAVVVGLTDGSISPAVGDPAVFAITLWGCTHGVIQIAMTKGEELARFGLKAEALYDNAFCALRLAMTPKN
jgi:AcrR family transcriptional regulator